MSHSTSMTAAVRLARDAGVDVALDSFTKAYITAALWSSTDNSNEAGGDPLDDNYDVNDIAPETLAKMVADCERFQKIASSMLTEDDCTYGGCPAIEMAGHDFWLTRCGHGAGFWDGDWPEHGDALTELCQMFGNVDLCVGDDGRIWSC